MNKQSYLNELSNHLKTNNVEDIEEIIAEYDIHFIRKMADGYTEEEIASKLAKPKEIALQFAQSESKTEKKQGNKILTGIGLFFSDLLTIPFFIMMYAWMFIIGAVSISSALCGICLIIRPLLPSDIIILPPMPYTGGAIMGAMMIAFCVLAAIAAIYSFALTSQLGKSYMRWHKNMTSGGKYPPYAIHPILKDYLRRKLRNVGMIAIIVFAAAFIIGYIVLAASAGSFGFWHVWHWFQ